MIEIPIGLLIMIGSVALIVAIIQWVVYVNVELKTRGELADENTERTSMELREIKKRLTVLENKKK